MLAGYGPTEPGVARALVEALPDGADARRLVVDARPRRRVVRPRPATALRHVANRGANGIDGVVSTAVGVALGSAAPDRAAHRRRRPPARHERPPRPAGAGGVDLTIVVVDNDGGGIFSFLPQATAVPADRFEQLFGTPHGVDLAGLAAAHGLPRRPISTDLGDLPGLLGDGPRLVRVRTDRAANVAVHQAIHDAVLAALD